MADRMPTDKRGERGLADLIKVIDELRPQTDTERDQMAWSLGFQFIRSPAKPEKPFHPLSGAWNRQRPKLKKPAAEKPPSFSSKFAMPPSPEPSLEPAGPVLESILKDLGKASAPVSVPAKADERMIRDLSGFSNAQGMPVARRGLFSSKTARGLLTAAVSQPVPGVDIDIPRLIAASSRRQILNKIPCNFRISARSGCQLLLDFSEGMTPLWPDLRDLMQQFFGVIGEEKCSVYEFEDEPDSATYWDLHDVEQFWRPKPGKPVVVASDLGLLRNPSFSSRSSTQIWFRFARKCIAYRVPLIAIIPVQWSMWPQGLDRVMKLIHWDPATTAAQVQRLMTQSADHR